MEYFPFSRHDLNISSKVFKIESPQIFGFIWIKFFNDLCIIIFSKRDSSKKVICSVRGIGRKFANIFNKRALLHKEIVEDLSLLLKISNTIVIMINW